MRTFLIILTGSGKTTLGNALKQALGYPLISKDHFKEALMDQTPPANRDESKRIGRASWAVMYAAIDELIGFIPGMIVDANFRRGIAEPDLRPRLEHCNGVLIHCITNRDTLLDRIRSRRNDPARHAGHFDQETIPGMLRVLDAGGFRLADLGVPVIDVDTTDGYRPELADVVAMIASASRS